MSFTLEMSLNATENMTNPDGFQDFDFDQKNLSMSELLYPNESTTIQPADNMTMPGGFHDIDFAQNLSMSELLYPNESTTMGPAVEGLDDLLVDTKEILFNIQYGLLPFFLVTGLLGNSLTIVTMMSRHFNHMTSRSILIFLSISDTILLLTQPFNKLWVIKLFGRDLRALSDVSCKVFFVIFRSAKMTSSWLVVLLCFERFVAVVYPLKAKAILRKRIIFPAIALDYIVNFIYNGVWSFSSQIVNGMCKPDIPSERQKIFVIIGCSIYSFIPTFLLMIFTPKIIHKLRRQMVIRKSLSSVNPSSGGSKKTTNRSTDDMVRASYMVLGVMIAYIVLIIPITLVHLIAFSQGVSAFDITTYSFFVFREIAQMLEQINYAVNFFFYILCSTMFRRRVLEIISCSGLRSRFSSGQSNNESSRSSMKKILQKVVSATSTRSTENSQ